MLAFVGAWAGPAVRPVGRVVPVYAPAAAVAPDVL